MIYVSKSQLNQVEYLIGQSILGHHVLFDTETLRKVFNGEVRAKQGQPKKKNEKDSDKTKDPVEQHIEKMIELPSLAHKKAYLERLDKMTFEQVVRAYFNIVENNLFEQQEAKH